MNPPPGPEFSDRALDVAEFSAKLVVAAGAVGAFALKVAKPIVEWNDRRKVEQDKKRSAEIRAALAPEVAMLSDLKVDLEQINRSESGCVARMEAVLSRQEIVFDDLDVVLKLVTVLHDRQDETNDFLDALGFASVDRRTEDPETRARVNAMIAQLRNRRKERHRELEERRSAAKPSIDAE